ncbi:uncharacterized protein LOC114973480 [Acropora millepora]|uniref:uncharacterized protein LOC114973480 n=1 Tax=Acropora millepora TaxID=45264 RepID=UPI001CF2E30D|nr:uncharacterized protein LOC114973480 [Acropora millepora]
MNMEWLLKKVRSFRSSPEDKKPPELSFKLKKAGDVPKSTEEWSVDHLPLDILLLTSVESFDFLSCFTFLDQPFKLYKKEIGVVYVGRMGNSSVQEKLKVALMNCSKGAAAPGGSLTVVLNAIRVLQPKAVFSVGTCISLSLEKARMGDVVISSKLTTAEGFKTPGSPLLGNFVRDAPYGWDVPLKNPDEWEVNIHCDGNILSQSMREKCRYDDICEQYPGAVAIETEGEGVYAAAYDANIEWVVVKGVASYFHQSRSATSEWLSFASTMAASVVAKMLSDPTVFREWPHYNQENPAVLHQAVAANNLGNQGHRAIPETVQRHPLDAVVTSCSENRRQGVCHGASGCLRKYGESYVKLLISTRNLEKEKEEAMKEMLTQEVHSYLKFNDHSGDDLHQAIASFTVHLINVYKVRLVTLGVASVIIFLDCPTLESLERLWSDCLSGHLHKVAERYLVTDEMKKKLDLETICLNATIEQENYWNCKKALMERPSTCSEIDDGDGNDRVYTSNKRPFQSLGNYRKTLEYHEKRLKIAKEVDDRAEEGKAYENLGDAYQCLSDYQKAIEGYEKQLEIALEIGDRGGESRAYGNLGKTCMLVGDYRKAIKYHEKKIGYRPEEVRAYENIGNAYHSLSDYVKAIEHHGKQLEIAAEIGDRGGELRAFGNLETGDWDGARIAYYNIGTGYFSLKQFKDAVDNFVCSVGSL